MISYAQTSDYNRLYSDITDEKALTKYLEIASIIINNATLTRIEKRGFNNLNDIQQELVKKATIEEAHFLNESGVLNDEDIASFTITDISVTEKDTDSITKKLNLSKVAHMYLKRTGLMSRII